MREQLADWMISHCRKTCSDAVNVEKGTALIEADEITSIVESSYLDQFPQRLVVRKECNACHTIRFTRLEGAGPSGIVREVPCFKCHGSGFITRPLTLREVVEYALQFNGFEFLPTGEKVEVSEK